MTSQARLADTHAEPCVSYYSYLDLGIPIIRSLALDGWEVGLTFSIYPLQLVILPVHLHSAHNTWYHRYSSMFFRYTYNTYCTYLVLRCAALTNITHFVVVLELNYSNRFIFSSKTNWLFFFVSSRLRRERENSDLTKVAEIDERWECLSLLARQERHVLVPVERRGDTYSYH